jgi:hypothetical protein
LYRGYVCVGLMVLGVVAVLAGCAETQPVEGPDVVGGEPNLIGKVADVQPSQEAGTPGHVLVDSPGDRTADKYMVSVTEETLILQQEGEDQRQTSFEALEAGQQVQLWFTGPVMESYPAQARAMQIVISD